MGAAPVVVDERELNSRDTLRVSLDFFEGGKVVDVRKFYRADNGAMRPTRKGLILSLARLPMLAEMVRAALDRAQADGLLPKDEGSA